MAARDMTASEVDVLERIRKIFRDVLHVEVASPDTDLVGSGVLDSLAFIELLHELEVEFEIEIPLDGVEIENFFTVQRIVGFVLEATGPGRQPVA
jgi:acyl carrier protein